MKKLLIALVLLAIVVFGVMYFGKPTAIEPATPADATATTEVPDDTTTAITQDLDSVQVEGNLDADFNALDADINSL